MSRALSSGTKHMHCVMVAPCFFFFNDTATTEIYTLSLHDALPISVTKNVEEQLKAAIRQANKAILTYGEEQSSARGLGCTVTTALVQDDQAFIANIGDSHSAARSEEHTSGLQSRSDLVCRLLLEKK